ncbi:hypothetical protein LzC2_42200 [Planctomycetes bacterium LzC2]|uniref:CARDB domain-containing protein n=2 Tax=Alienimonas chondri TaxID=2681879 RepID=A0ABX1VJ08_9PLAN|nr:hypothetical protein [Alienimonas chondri]
MSHADRELIVVSDLQTGALPADAADAFRRGVDDLDLPPALTLLPVGEGSGNALENVSVEQIESPARPVGVGRPVRLRATLRNHATTDRTVRAVLSVDGAEAGVQSVVVPAGGTVGALFVHPFDAPGTHAVAVTATPGDALPADDVGRTAVRVLGRLPVLLVDGAPSNRPLAGETDFLSIALTPLSFGAANLEGGKAADLIETSTLAPSELTAEALAEARLVVLANVDRLTDDALTALTEFVQTGGSLLIAAGDKVDLRWHRDRLFNDGAGLLPRAWTGVAGGDDAASRVLAERFDHPALEPFNDPANGDLTTAPVRRWMTVEQPKQDADDASEQNGGRVVARLDTADPLLIVKPFGRGTVVQMTTAVDADWSDLPLRPSFVPLMQGLAATLATRPAPPATLVPGEPAIASVPAAVEAVAAVAPDGRRSSVTAVESSEEEVDEGDGAPVVRLARYENTRLPGFYELSWPSAGPDDPAIARFAVSADPRESVPGTLSEAEGAALAERLGATIVTSAAEYRARDDRRRHGSELWRWVLAGLLAALFLELILQQRFSMVPGGRSLGAGTPDAAAGGTR